MSVWIIGCPSCSARRLPDRIVLVAVVVLLAENMSFIVDTIKSLERIRRQREAEKATEEKRQRDRDPCRRTGNGLSLRHSELGGFRSTMLQSILLVSPSVRQSVSRSLSAHTHTQPNNSQTVGPFEVQPLRLVSIEYSLKG